MRSSVLLWLGRHLRYLGSQERIFVTEKMAQGKLGAEGIAHEVWLSLRRWNIGDWGVSTLIFLVLMSLTMTKTWGSYLWLGVAPLANALMLLLIREPILWKEILRKDGVRMAIRTGITVYTLLSWLFLYFVMGSFVALFIGAILDWGLLRLPWKRVANLSVEQLAWVIPLLFLIGVILRSFRFYLGVYLVLPLVVFRKVGILAAIRSSRVALRGSHLTVCLWMLAGWFISLIPALLLFVGSTLIISQGMRLGSASPTTLWQIYGASSLWFLFCLVFAVFLWPVAPAIQAAFYERVFGSANQQI
jgi:hypothetical protein